MVFSATYETGWAVVFGHTMDWSIFHLALAKCRCVDRNGVAIATVHIPKSARKKNPLGRWHLENLYLNNSTHQEAIRMGEIMSTLSELPRAADAL